VDGLGVLVFRVEYRDVGGFDDEIRRAAKTLADAGLVVIDVGDPEFLSTLERSVATLKGDVPAPDALPPGW
jgi:hypothetical protein